MRLLLTTDFYHPFIGGAERQMQLLAEELARRGHAVRVATTAMPGRPAVETIGDVEVHRLGTLAARLPFGGGDPARRFLPPAPDQPLPACIAGKRAGPPEHVGGAWGYQALLEARANPKHPERENFAVLIASFNPDAFDLAAVNRVLAKVK